MTSLKSLRQGVETQQGTSGLDSAEVLTITGAAGGGTDVYETLDSLPSSSLVRGSKALVKDVNRLYLTDGNGWYNTALFNRGPRWDSGGEPEAEYEIVDSATPLVITARAIDSDNVNFLNQSTVTDSAQYMVDITNDSSVFTFTPKSADSIGAEVAAGNLVDSNGDFTYTFKWSDGISFVSKAVTITYNVTGGGGGVWYGDRAIAAGGFGNTNVIQYYSNVTSGNSVDFGDLLGSNNSVTGVSGGSRGVFAGGASSSNVISYITTTTPGNATSFGTLNVSRSHAGGAADGTTGIFAGGNAGGTYAELDAIEYITIATPGNGTDFGNLTQERGAAAAAGDATRGIINRGSGPAPGYTYSSSQDYITYATAGNATSFGYGGAGAMRVAGTSDETRCIWAGGYNQSGNAMANIYYTVTQSGGSATSFGSLTGARYSPMASSNGTNATFGGGGSTSSTQENDISKIVIQTTSNATGWGDLLADKVFLAGVSGDAA